MQISLVRWWLLPLWVVFALGSTSATTAQAQSGTSAALGDRPAISLRLGSFEPEPTSPAGDAPAEPKTRGFYIWPDRPPLEGSISTDRPGFSDSYMLVPRGYQQLESGYSFYYDREDSTRTTNNTLGEFSLRLGLMDNFELRIKWTGYSMTESHYDDVSRWAGRRVTTTDHDDGWTDMSIGFKSQLLKQDGLVPNLSIIPAISLPTGSGSKSTGDVDPEVRLAWNYGLNEKLAIYGVVLAAGISDDQGRFFQSGASFAFSYTLNDKLSWFTEYYGLYPSTRDSDCQHNIDFGPVFLINENFQVDVRAGFGLNEEAPDFQAGIGFCYRF